MSQKESQRVQYSAQKKNPHAPHLHLLRPPGSNGRSLNARGDIVSLQLIALARRFDYSAIAHSKLRDVSSGTKAIRPVNWRLELKR
jgi:hypothetical protein